MRERRAWGGNHLDNETAVLPILRRKDGGGDEMNLKNETLQILNENGKRLEDVRWVGCNDFSIPVPLFWELANQEYDSGFGAQEVAFDLVVVGNDFWLERHEHDGSEWWEFKERPLMPKEVRYVRTLIGREHGPWWSSLADLNESEEVRP